LDNYRKSAARNAGIPPMGSLGECVHPGANHSEGGALTPTDRHERVIFRPGVRVCRAGERATPLGVDKGGLFLLVRHTTREAREK
jgi:hypothetical protein